MRRSPIRRARRTPSRASTASAAGPTISAFAAATWTRVRQGRWRSASTSVAGSFTPPRSFPLDGALTAGFGTQLASGSYDSFFVPIGISLGRRIDLENSKTSFVPYFQPVIVPTFYSGDNAPDGGVDFALGLGVDIKFGGQLDLRVSGGIGDIDGVAIGLAYVH